MIGLLGVALAGPDLAQIRATTDGLAQPLLDAGILHHVVIGVISEGEMAVWALGEGARPDAVYELGNVSAAVTGILLADAIQRGELSVDATLDDVLGVKGPAWQGQPAPLFDLAAHTSGLPALPAGFRPSDPADPFAGTTREALLAALIATPLDDRPGGSYLLSPLGVAGLGLALERATGLPYPELVRARLGQPMGLGSLTVDGGSATPGHDADGLPARPWTLGAWAPAGGLEASAPDLLALASACMARPLPLGPAVSTALGTQRDLGESGGMGLGWHLAPDGTAWQNGRTGGHHALIALNPARGIAVVALGDMATAAVDELGFGVLGALAGQTPAPVGFRAATPVDPAVLDGLAGTWGPASVRRDGAGLRISVPGQPDRRVHPAGQGRFFARSVPFELVFEARRVTVTRAGGVTEVWKRAP